MTLTRSLPTQHAAGLPLIDERRLTAGLFARNADGTARAGVLPAHTNPLVTGRASMGYDIAAFNAVTARTSAGAEEIANDGSVTVTTTAAPGTNSRIDVIWVRSQFVVLGDANNDVVFGVTQGTAGVAPSKPSIPAGALELAMAEIPSTATTTLSSGVVITQSSPFTASAGGVVWLRNQAEEDAWGVADGAVAYRLDLNAPRYRIGGQWRANQVSKLLGEWHKNVGANSPGGRPLGPVDSTFAIPAVGYARAIRLTVVGGALVSSNGDAGLIVTPSTGAWAGGTNSHRIVTPASSVFTDLAYVFYMANLPANTALNLTMVSASSVLAGYDLHFTVEEF